VRIWHALTSAAEVPATTLQEDLDWAWRYANVVQQGNPWIRTGLRSAMVGDVFLVNGETHSVMLMGLNDSNSSARETHCSCMGDKPGRRSHWPMSRSPGWNNPTPGERRLRVKAMGRRPPEMHTDPKIYYLKTNTF
jgi:hypothetical protein